MMMLSPGYLPSPYTLDAFQIAHFDWRGIPKATPPADRLLFGLMGWEGRAFVAHLMTEFYDPWEHFYDGFRSELFTHFLPAPYRVHELAAAMRQSPGWVDQWCAQRLLRLRPPLHVLADFVAYHLSPDQGREVIERGYSDEQGLIGPLIDRDLQTLLERLLQGFTDNELSVAPVEASIPAVLDNPGAPGSMRWNPVFMNACGGFDSPKFAQMIGRCMVNADWSSIEGRIETEPATGRIEVQHAVFDILQKQLAGSRCPEYESRHSPMRQGSAWLHALVSARLHAACLPTTDQLLTPLEDCTGRRNCSPRHKGRRS